METKADKKAIAVSATIAAIILIAGISVLIYFSVKSGDDDITTTTSTVSQHADLPEDSDPEKEPDTSIEKAFKKAVKKAEPRAETTIFKVNKSYKDFHFYRLQLTLEGESENHVMCVFLKGKHAYAFHVEPFKKSDKEEQKYIDDCIKDIKSNYSKYEKEANAKIDSDDVFKIY